MLSDRAIFLEKSVELIRKTAQVIYGRYWHLLNRANEFYCGWLWLFFVCKFIKLLQCVAQAV